MMNLSTSRGLTPAPELSEDSGPLPAVGHRFEYIDGLRALAALWVALHHAMETAIPQQVLGTRFWGPLLLTLSRGQFPVMVFLMLSGFCLYHPLVRRNPRGPTFSNFAAYIKRRATRIGPPYLAAGVLCLILAAIPAVQIGRWGEIVNPITGKVILSHLFLVHNLIPEHATKIDFPMWSIGLEWQLYLVFPLLVWSLRRFHPGLTLTVTVLVAAVIRATYRHMPQPLSGILRDGPLAYLEIFVLGMLAASLIGRGYNLRVPPRLLAVVAALGFLAVRAGSGNGLGHDLETSIATFCLLLLAATPGSAVGRFLGSPGLVKIGYFSYSLYLVHAPLIHLFWMVLRPLPLSDDVRFAILALVAMPLVVLASYGFHRLFERPFMRVKPVVKLV
jgi:peptidoglycan/LPS O-acetylase OafA/YrhL